MWWRMRCPEIGLTWLVPYCKVQRRAGGDTGRSAGRSEARLEGGGLGEAMEFLFEKGVADSIMHQRGQDM